jgi:hypothetical protein
MPAGRSALRSVHRSDTGRGADCAAPAVRASAAPNLPVGSSPGFLLPFSCRHWLVGSSCSRSGTALSTRGRRCSPGQMPCPAVACRFPAASPCTPLPHPTGGALFYEASTGVHATHPSGLPFACGHPDGTGGPWAFPCAPHLAVTGDAQQGGAGHEHAPGTTPPT